jgi:hypothetical protein
LGAEPTVKEIAQQARERGGLNWASLKAELKVVTTSADGRVKEQQLTTSSRKIVGKTHTVSRFVSPPGVAGVAVLVVEGGPAVADDISLYLPKLKRVRKVAATERGKAFMDTDFSYADLGGGGAKDEDFAREKDEKVDGRDAWVIKGKPGDSSPYGLVTLWVDKATSVPLKAEYADKDGKPFKRYRTLNLKAFKGRTLAASMSMENLQTNSKTVLTVLSLDDSALGDDAFTERALERG